MSTKKKIITVVIGVEAVIIAAVIVFLFYINSDTVKISRQLELAQKYLLEEDYEQAIAVFEGIIEIDPKNEEAYLGMAEAYAAADDLENAVQILEKASQRIDSEEVLAMLETHTAEIEQRQQAAQAAAQAAADAAASSERTSAEASTQNTDAIETQTPEAEVVLTGFIVQDGELYYYDETGNYVTGWFDKNNNRYCARDDGRLYKDGEHEIDSSKYTFDQGGVCLGEVEEESWKQAYIDLINERGTTDQYGNEYRYCLIYLDNDNIPELVLDAYGATVSICTYKEGQIYEIMESWGYGTGGFYEYIPRKNTVVDIHASAGYGEIDTYWIQNDKHELVEYLKYSLPLNDNGDFDEDNAQYFYYGKEISQEEYNTYYIDGEHETLEGTESVDAMIQIIKGMQ